VNALRTRLGMIYVAALVLVVVCIPLMHEAKQLHTPKTWPAVSIRSSSGFLG
jgi:hypothetical protein